MFSQSRIETDLSGKGWKLIKDKDQSWKKDSFYLPPVNIEKLPVHSPTGGWEFLNTASAKEVCVPGTNEQFFQQISGPDANMTGVWWWYRNIQIPTSKNSQKIILRFESTRYRSEIFINQKLVGYDIIGNTPFEVDITNFVKPGETAQLAVRITNPGGIFDWKDGNIKWDNRIVAGSLGFGGITGNVKLLTCNGVYIDDIYMQNIPVATSVNAIITINNTSNKVVIRDLFLRIVERKNEEAQVYTRILKSVKLKPGKNVINQKIEVANAKLWDIDHPNLYTCQISLNDKGIVSDSDKKNFGFRWFELSGIGSDAMLRLNGKRIVLRTAISWGFWPVSGMVPTPELAEKQIRLAKKLGLNMLNFHRCIGQPLLLDLADELGLLYFEEPGNYGKSIDYPIAHKMLQEKLKRMVYRDRSHPSLVVYCMQNEAQEVKATAVDIYRKDMKMAHEIDPSRTIVRTSGWAKVVDLDDPFKLHMRPFDTIPYLKGWYDFHRAGGPHTWMQSFYNSPKNYYSITSNKREIVYWGEEGALSTPGRVEMIKSSLDKNPTTGWDGVMYLDQYNDFKSFFESKKLNTGFSNVDALTKSMGNISFEHQGRKIEHSRINNLTDGYAINGWESEILENHSGVVDCYRNPKGDPEILAYYNQPLYIAVKTRKQVANTLTPVETDFYIVNEKDLKGAHTLHIKAKNSIGEEIFSKDIAVTISGSDVFGELIAEAITIPNSKVTGMVSIEAELSNSRGEIVAKGRDQILVVNWKDEKLQGNGAVWEPSLVVREFLANQTDAKVQAYSPKLPKLDWMIAARSPKSGELGYIPTEQLLDLNAKQGVTVSYFMGGNFEKLVAQQNKSLINFTLKDGATPHPNVTTTLNYSIRWEGHVVPATTGKYKFDLEFTPGDQASFYVNGQKCDTIIDSHCKLALNLEAGKPVKLLVELRHVRRSTALTLLKWSVPEKELFDPQQIIDRVKNDGTTLIILSNASSWMDIITKNTNVKYKGDFTVGTNWLGGVHFVKAHPLFKDLPVNQGMDWPYEAVVSIGSERIGLIMDGEELVAGAYHCFPQKLGTAVGVIPCGKGKIVFSTLEIYNNLRSPESTADVARKLLCNFIQFAGNEK